MFVLQTEEHKRIETEKKQQLERQQSMESERKAREVGTLVRVFIYPPNIEGGILE